MTVRSASGASDPSAPGVLAVDIGAGTSDILFARRGDSLENAVKLVVPSPTRIVAARIAAATARGQTVVFRGPVMGGGACGSAMKAHLAAGFAFVATESAAASFADDLDAVRAAGARVVGDEVASEVLRRLPEGVGVEIRSGDLDAESLCRALELLGVEPRFAAVAVAVQDHGYCPDGSNRVFRFRLWEQAVAERRPISGLFYDAAETPAALTRLRAAAAAAMSLAGGGPALVADTGPAALYGALPEGASDAVLVNVGNGHTVCLLARERRVAGVFEHHTRMLDGRGLELRLRRWLAGDLRSDEVRADGGHGAILASGVGDVAALPMMVTGPRREMLVGDSLPYEFAAPHGDMMLTGCFGLLRALTERGLPVGR